MGKAPSYNVPFAVDPNVVTTGINSRFLGTDRTAGSEADGTRRTELPILTSVATLLKSASTTEQSARRGAKH